MEAQISPRRGGGPECLPDHAMSTICPTPPGPFYSRVLCRFYQPMLNPGRCIPLFKKQVARGEFLRGQLTLRQPKLLPVNFCLLRQFAALPSNLGRNSRPPKGPSIKIFPFGIQGTCATDHLVPTQVQEVLLSY